MVGRGWRVPAGRPFEQRIQPLVPGGVHRRGGAAGGAGPVGSPAQPTVASPATGGAGGSAKTAQTKKQAQLTGFSSKETETKSEAPAPAPKTKEHAAAAKQARQLIAAAQTKLSSRASPDKIKIGWLAGEEGLKARVRGSK